MTELDYLAVVAAAVTAFLLSTVWYMGFGARLAKLADAYATVERPPAWMMMAGRCQLVGLTGWLRCVSRGGAG